VREQVDDDQETGYDGQPWPRNSRENDVEKAERSENKKYDRDGDK